jgi:hypothetical protein
MKWRRNGGTSAVAKRGRRRAAGRCRKRGERRNLEVVIEGCHPRSCSISRNSRSLHKRKEDRSDLMMAKKAVALQLLHLVNSRSLRVVRIG